MNVRPEPAWGCVCINGHPRNFIHNGTIRPYRAESKRCVADSWTKPGETWRQGWKRAYNVGWRCVRVRITVER